MSGEDTLDLNIDTYLAEKPSQKECVYLLQIVFQHSHWAQHIAQRLELDSQSQCASDHHHPHQRLGWDWQTDRQLELLIHEMRCEMSPTRDAIPAVIHQMNLISTWLALSVVPGCPLRLRKCIPHCSSVCLFILITTTQRQNRGVEEPTEVATAGSMKCIQGGCRWLWLSYMWQKMNVVSALGHDLPTMPGNAIRRGCSVRASIFVFAEHSGE